MQYKMSAARLDPSTFHIASSADHNRSAKAPNLPGVTRDTLHIATSHLTTPEIPKRRAFGERLRLVGNTGYCILNVCQYADPRWRLPNHPTDPKR